MAKYCCFFCPSKDYAEKELDDKCPSCGRTYDFVLNHPPAKIGNYRITKHLGRGFYGAAYVAEAGFVGKKYVIKISPVAFYDFELFKNDLHSENLIVERLRPESRRPDAIDPMLRVMAIDLGSVSDDRQGDLSFIAEHVNALLAKLLTRPDRMQDRDFRVALVLQGIISSLCTDAEMSARRLYDLNRRANYSRNLKNHALAFAQTAHDLLVRSYRKAPKEGKSKARLRQYSSIYVRVTAEDSARKVSQAWYLSPKRFDEKRFSSGVDSIRVYDIRIPERS